MVHQNHLNVLELLVCDCLCCQKDYFFFFYFILLFLMSTVNQQIKKNVKAATSKKPQVKKIAKESITSESSQIKKDASTNGKPKVTQGQKLLQAMTAQKAAKQALLKGVKNTHVSFDEEGNEDRVETVVQKKEDNKGEKRKNEEQIEENKEKPRKKIKKNKVKVEETRRENKQEGKKKQ